MDVVEARTVADAELERAVAQPFDVLARLVVEPDSYEVTAASGRPYTIEVLAVWDTGTPGGDLRVLVSVGDGSLRRFVSPLTVDALVSPGHPGRG